MYEQSDLHISIGNWRQKWTTSWNFTVPLDIWCHVPGLTTWPSKSCKMWGLNNYWIFYATKICGNVPLQSASFADTYTFISISDSIETALCNPNCYNGLLIRATSCAHWHLRQHGVRSSIPIPFLPIWSLNYDYANTSIIDLISHVLPSHSWKPRNNFPNIQDSHCGLAWWALLQRWGSYYQTVQQMFISHFQYNTLQKLVGYPVLLFKTQGQAWSGSQLLALLIHAVSPCQWNDMLQRLLK